MPCRPQRGFTLIELMVAMAILVIVLSVGLPSFEGVTNGSRLSSATSELNGAVQLARAEALRRNRNVVLCRTNDMLSCASGSVWSAWLVFVDNNSNDQVTAGEEILRSGSFASPVEVRASAAITGRESRITFLSTGLARAADEQALLTATLALCVPSARPSDNTRELSLAFGGRTTVLSRNTGGVCSQPADS